MKKLELKQNKLNLIIDGLIAIVLGIMILLIGIGNTLDIYFGILLVVGAASLIALGFIAMYKKLPFLVPFVAGGAIMAAGIALFCRFTTVQWLIPFAVIGLLGAGCGLVAHSIYVMVKLNFIYGLGECALGAIAVTVTALYINIPGFQQVFWYVMGALVIAGGAAVLILGIVKKD